MAEIGRWNGHIFEVSSELLRSFSELSIKAGCETEDKTSGKQKYASRKAGNASEVSLTVTLLSMLGCDVRAEVDAFLSDACAGKKDYFYVGGGKLLPCQLMLTNADATEIEISPTSIWTSAKIKLTMKQADKGDAASSSTGSGGKSSGSKKESVKTDSLVSIVAGKVKEQLTEKEGSGLKAVQKIIKATKDVKLAQEKSKEASSAGKNTGGGKTILAATR